MSHVDKAALHLLDCPGQQVIGRAWCAEVEGGKFAAERVNIKRRRDAPARDALVSSRKFPGQDIVPMFSKVCTREEW